jgi:hypothetical protein
LIGLEALFFPARRPISISEGEMNMTARSIGRAAERKAKKAARKAAAHQANQASHSVAVSAAAPPSPFESETAPVASAPQGTHFGQIQRHSLGRIMTSLSRPKSEIGGSMHSISIDFLVSEGEAYKQRLIQILERAWPEESFGFRQRQLLPKLVAHACSSFDLLGVWMEAQRTVIYGLGGSQHLGNEAFHQICA